MDCSLAGSLSMVFSRQEYWNGSLFPSPGDLPNPGIEPRFPALQADCLPAEPPGKPKKRLKEKKFTLRLYLVELLSVGKRITSHVLDSCCERANIC